MPYLCFNSVAFDITTNLGTAILIKLASFLVTILLIFTNQTVGVYLGNMHICR
jgi:hypothetical protein